MQLLATDWSDPTLSALPYRAATKRRDKTCSVSESVIDQIVDLGGVLDETEEERRERKEKKRRKKEGKSRSDSSRSNSSSPLKRRGGNVDPMNRSYSVDASDDDQSAVSGLSMGSAKSDPDEGLKGKEKKEKKGERRGPLAAFLRGSNKAKRSKTPGRKWDDDGNGSVKSFRSSRSSPLKGRGRLEEARASNIRGNLSGSRRTRSRGRGSDGSVNSSGSRTSFISSRSSPLRTRADLDRSRAKKGGSRLDTLSLTRGRGNLPSSSLSSKTGDSASSNHSGASFRSSRSSPLRSRSELCRSRPSRSSTPLFRQGADDGSVKSGTR